MNIRKATDRQIYDFIVAHRQKNGWSPTIREICDGVGIRSASTMHARLQSMKYKGMIRDGGPKSARTVIPIPEEEWSGHADS